MLKSSVFSREWNVAEESASGGDQLIHRISEIKK